MTTGVLSGPQTIDPDGGGDIEVFCDMDTDNGGWTLVAVVANGDGQNWQPSTGNWENQSLFGSPDPFANNDHKSAAYHRLDGSELMFWHDGSYLLRSALGSCLDNESVGAMLNSFTGGSNGWECGSGGSLNPGSAVACAHACLVEEVALAPGDLALTDGQSVTRLYIKAGESDGSDVNNQDRVYFSTEERGDIHNVMGLGARCGGFCLGNGGEADMSESGDGIDPMGAGNVYSLFVR